MCILALAIGAHPDIPFICVHNRDEELDRPTAPPSASEPVLCGRDLKAGGTWMGVHKGTGAFAAITNHVNRSFLPPPEEKKVSRGILIRELLQLTAAETHAKFSHGADNSSKSDFGREFDGFNLLHGNLFEAQPELFFISNRPQQLLFPDVPASAYNNASAYYRRVPAGVHCVSNGQFDDESWPKVRYLRRRLELALTHVPVDVTSRQLRHAATAASADAQRVEVLRRVLSRAMSFSTSFADGDLPDLSYADDPPAVTRGFHRVFLPHKNGKGVGLLPEWGTRAQTIIVRTHLAVYYLYRSTDHYPHRMQWSTFVTPLPSAASAHPAVDSGLLHQAVTSALEATPMDEDTVDDAKHAQDSSSRGGAASSATAANQPGSRLSGRKRGAQQADLVLQHTAHDGSVRPKRATR